MKDYMLIPVEIKSIEKKQEDGSEYIYVDGLASFYNNIDLGRDRVLKGFFSEDLSQRGNERPALWQHKSAEPVGINFYTDTDIGLAFSAKLPTDDTFVMGRVYPQLKVGSVKGASIGYETQESNYNEELSCRDLIKGRIHESSFVTFAMNPKAQIFSVRKQLENIDSLEIKSSGMREPLLAFAKELNLAKDIDSKAVPPYKDYAIAEDVKWDKAKAVKQIREHTNSSEKPSSSYKNCFMFYDSENPDQFTAYKMPYVYFMGGSFKAVPKALSAIVGALGGARGGVDIPNADKSKIKAQINKYYKKMDREEPFKNNNTIFIDKKTLEGFEKRDYEKLFDENIILSSQAKKKIVDNLNFGNEVEDIRNDSFLKGLDKLESEINKL
jgi:HK97 family phage prohead protease